MYFVLLPLVMASIAYSQTALSAASAYCAVTQPNWFGPSDRPNSNLYGTGMMSVTIEPKGTVVFKSGGAGFVTHDGSLGMKWAWWQSVRGQLEIEGHRLDKAAPPLRAETHQLNPSYGDSWLRKDVIPLPLRSDIPTRSNAGYWDTTYLIFSKPGCWR
jgi:hypothetical protein